MKTFLLLKLGNLLENLHFFLQKNLQKSYVLLKNKLLSKKTIILEKNYFDINVINKLNLIILILFNI